MVNLRSEFEAKDKVGKWVYGEVTGWNRRVLKSCASIIFLKLCFLIEGLFCIWFSAYGIGSAFAEKWFTIFIYYFVGEKRQIEIGLQLELYSTVKGGWCFGLCLFFVKKQNFDFTFNEIYR